MPRFVVRVTEINSVDYTIDAENQTAAEKAANEWVATHAETVDHDLSKDWRGWDTEILGTVDPVGKPDICEEEN